MIEHDDATWLGGLCWELDEVGQALEPRAAAKRLRAIAGRVRLDGRIAEDHAAQTTQLLENYADAIEQSGKVLDVVERANGLLQVVHTHNLLAVAAGLLQVSRQEPRSRHRLIFPPK